MVVLDTNERCKSRQAITQSTNKTAKWTSQEVSISSRLRGIKGCAITSGHSKYLRSVQNLANLIKNANKLAGQSRKVFQKGVHVFRWGDSGFTQVGGSPENQNKITKCRCFIWNKAPLPFSDYEVRYSTSKYLHWKSFQTPSTWSQTKKLGTETRASYYCYGT